MTFPHRDASYLYNAAHLADVAVAAYHGEDHAAIRHWPHRRHFAVGAEQGVVVWNDTDAVIGIAGTNDAYDMLANFDCRTTRVSAFAVHAGFAQGCQVIAAAVRDLGLPTFRGPLRWWLCGHSAGAAKASILPLMLPDLWPEQIVTFASPRCFRKSCAQLYEYPVRRFDHPHDLVPDVPLSGRLGVFKRMSGWSHVGTPTYIWTDGTIDTENGHRLTRVLRHVWMAGSIRPSQISRAAISDHSMEGVYARALSKWKRLPNLVPLVRNAR